MKYLRHALPKTWSEWRLAIVSTPLLLVYMGVVVPPVWALSARESRDGWRLALLGVVLDLAVIAAYVGFA